MGRGGGEKGGFGAEGMQVLLRGRAFERCLIDEASRLRS